MTNATAALTGDNGGADTGTDTGAADGAQQSWTEGLGEEYSGLVENKGWKGVEDVLSSYSNLEKFAGGSKNLVELPGEDADQTTLDSFYGKLGRPDSPENYTFEIPDGGDQELGGWFKSTAHEAGLSDKQAATLFQKWEEMSSQRVESMEDNIREQGEAAITELKKEWGKGYDSQIDAGKRAVNALGYDEQQLSQMEEKLGTADMLKLFATIGSKMGEDTFEGGESPSNSGFGITPEAARQQIGDLKLDKSFMDKYLSGDKDAIAKMTRLNEAAYG